MTSRDPRPTSPAFADDQSSKTHHEPLLGRNRDHDRFEDDENDVERGIGNFNGGFSRRSSLEMSDAPFEQISLQQRPSWTADSWTTKALSYVSRSARRLEGRKSRSGPVARDRSRSGRVVGYLVAIILMVFGVVQVISLCFLTLAAVLPDQAAYFFDHWGDPSKSSKSLLHWPTDFSRDIQPVPCHSHNDYWREIPLYSALQAGCISVEADVWLVDDELYVGHSTSSLTSNRTFKSLYINPLLDILNKQNPTTNFHPDLDSPPNGVFDTDASQTLILLIDFKTDGHTLWPHVTSQLDPLRQAGYLTTFSSSPASSITQRPITVVATGNAPFDLLTSNHSHRDIFFDAPLNLMSAEGATAAASSSSPTSAQGTYDNAPQDASAYNATNSYYASTSFSTAIGSVWSEPSSAQSERIRAQIRGAHQRGLKARYWETPAWPRGLRNHMWNVLVREGVDVLNVDDLKAATGKSWGDWRNRV